MQTPWRVFIFSVLIALPGALAAEEPTVPAPVLLPHTTREMKTAGFWISRLPSPDKTVLTEEEISQFNAHVRDALKLTKDITDLLAFFSGPDLADELKTIVEGFRQRELYQGEVRVKGAFFDGMKKQMNIDAVGLELKPLPGIIVRFADQRFFPTKDRLYAKPGDVEFDEFQNSALDAGTPVLVRHESLDGKWCYVQSELSAGWVEKDKVATVDFAVFKKFVLQKDFIITTSVKADIFLDRRLTRHYEFVRMGMRFPLLSETDTAYEISLPLRNDDGTAAFKSGFVKKSGAHVGYLSYTPRHVIEQAFALLNAPYGWGGANGEQDCSRFLQEVFATVGVDLPRDSKNQAQVGLKIAEFDKLSADDEKIFTLGRKASPGTTLLTMKGHIMLYLGVVDGRVYAVHAPWAYRTKEGNQTVAHVINRVAVTDLSLGEGSPKGSLLERLSSAVLVANAHKEIFD